MILNSIDPPHGWAHWTGGVLAACGLAANFAPLAPGALVIELPQIYRATKSKGDPNDLIKLAVRVGEYKHAVERHGYSVTMPLPNEWKGQVPKVVHHKRVRGALTTQELAIVCACMNALPKGEQHNVWDAIGLGLWKLGRLGRGGV